MTSVQPCELPETALLCKYQDGGGYADCYVTEIAGRFSQADFVEAFYTTTLFRIERSILRWLAARPSSDREARELAFGTATSFAAWQVESRYDDQLLLADFTGRTRSWLMTSPVNDTAASRTRLYFGSAVVSSRNAETGSQGKGLASKALYRFHRLYSRLLLQSARSRLISRRQPDGPA
jgi:hypothetical protein